MGFYNDAGKWVEDTWDDTKDEVGGAVDDTLGVLKEIWKVIKELIKIPIKIAKLIPSIIELMELTIKCLILGVDFMEDMFFILPPLLVLFSTHYLIYKYEYGMETRYFNIN